MNCKNCNVILLWLAAGLLAVSLLFPNGFDGVKLPEADPTPVTVKVTDPTIVQKLATATPAELERINGVYSGLITVLRRDKGNVVKTTEQWETLAARTLRLAIDEPGKYPGLDEAIEAVFVKTVGTTDVLPSNPDTLAKLITACEIVANSATR